MTSPPLHPSPSSPSQISEHPASDQSFHYGQFADGTPISAESVQAWRSLSHGEKVARNLAQMDLWVVSWEELLQIRVAEQAALSEPQSMNPYASALEYPSHRLLPDIKGKPCVVIFMHVPKVGGTTLETLFSRNYKPNYLTHINSPALEKRPYVLFKHEKLPRVIMGHHKVNSILYQIVDHPILHVLLLREPISRIISYYDYLHTDEEHTLYPKVSQMTLAEFVESEEFVELENAQALRLIGYLQAKKKSTLSLSPAEVLAEAKRTLTQRMTVVGITEEYTKFLIMLKRVLKLNDIFHVRQNVSKQKTNRASVDSKIIQTIGDRNAIDLELYAYAKSLFQGRCAQLGITDAHVQRFHDLNGAYQRLMVEAGEGL
jgi:hypothetical protein